MREKRITYAHDPGPQWTVGELRAAIAELPDDTLVQVAYGLDAPHKKVIDFQPVIGAEFLSGFTKGEEVADTTFSIVTDFEAGEYDRFEPAYDDEEEGR